MFNDRLRYRLADVVAFDPVSATALMVAGGATSALGTLAAGGQILSSAGGAFKTYGSSAKLPGSLSSTDFGNGGPRYPMFS